jgi:hypothetical protein
MASNLPSLCTCWLGRGGRGGRGWSACCRDAESRRSALDLRMHLEEPAPAQPGRQHATAMYLCIALGRWVPARQACPAFCDRSRQTGRAADNTAGRSRAEHGAWPLMGAGSGIDVLLWLLLAPLLWARRGVAGGVPAGNTGLRSALSPAQQPSPTRTLTRTQHNPGPRGGGPGLHLMC